MDQWRFVYPVRLPVHPSKEKLQKDDVRGHRRRRRNGKRKPSKWVGEHKTVFNEHGVDWVKPVVHRGAFGGNCKYLPEQESDNLWYKTLPDREKHVIEFYRRFYKHAQERRVPWNLNDSLSRSTKVVMNQEEHTSRTVTPSSKLWCAWLTPPRYLIGSELMSLQGMFPDMYSASSCSDHQRRVLSGNAFSTTVLAAVIMATLAEVAPYLD